MFDACWVIIFRESMIESTRNARSIFIRTNQKCSPNIYDYRSHNYRENGKLQTTIIWTVIVVEVYRHAFVIPREEKRHTSVKIILKTQIEYSVWPTGLILSQKSTIGGFLLLKKKQKMPSASLANFEQQEARKEIGIRKENKSSSCMNENVMWVGFWLIL